MSIPSSADADLARETCSLFHEKSFAQTHQKSVQSKDHPMEKVRSFLEKFLEKEAKVYSLERIPELEAYNAAVRDYHADMAQELREGSWEQPLTELKSPEAYGKFKNYPAEKPRFLFKISEYAHPGHGRVWAAFVSESNPGADYKALCRAMFIIEDDEQLKLVKILKYENYDVDGHEDNPPRWKVLEGSAELDFDTLKDPVRIERYMEPEDEGMSVYHANI